MTREHLHSPRQLLRSRSGMIFGVCRGLADYASVNVIGLRLVFLALLFFSGIFPMVGVYVLAALIMKPEPVLPPLNDDEWEFYNSYTSSRGMALGRLKSKFEQLERRTRRLESIVTAKEYDWEQRLRSGI